MAHFDSVRYYALFQPYINNFSFLFHTILLSTCRIPADIFVCVCRSFFSSSLFHSLSHEEKHHTHTQKFNVDGFLVFGNCSWLSFRYIPFFYSRGKNISPKWLQSKQNENGFRKHNKLVDIFCLLRILNIPLRYIHSFLSSIQHMISGLLLTKWKLRFINQH